MSQNNKTRRGLSQEELELHQVLDSLGSVSTATATPPMENAQNTTVNNNNITNNNEEEK